MLVIVNITVVDSSSSSAHRVPRDLMIEVTRYNIHGRNFSKGKHRPPDDDGAVEEDVGRIRWKRTHFDAPYITQETHCKVATHP